MLSFDLYVNSMREVLSLFIIIYPLDLKMEGLGRLDTLLKIILYWNWAPTQVAVPRAHLLHHYPIVSYPQQSQGIWKSGLVSLCLYKERVMYE